MTVLNENQNSPLDVRSLLESGANKGLDVISGTVNMSSETFLQLVLDEIAMGRLSRLHLYFVWSKDQRVVMQSGNSLTDEGYKRTGLTRRQHDIFKAFRRANIFQSEIYSIISSIELELHDYVKLVLKQSLGSDDWWSGVPQPVREKCAVRAEQERSEGASVAYPHSLYNMTTFTDLWRIIDKNYHRFEWASETLKAAKISKETLANKGLFTQNFNRLMKYRNATMHPIKLVRFRCEDYLWVCDRLAEFSIDPFSYHSDNDLHDQLLAYLSEEPNVNESDAWALAEIMSIMGQAWNNDPSSDSRLVAMQHLEKLGITDSRSKELVEQARSIWMNIYCE